MLQSSLRATLLVLFVMCGTLRGTLAFSQNADANLAVPKLASSDAQAFAFVVAGMKQERRRLVSGTCRFRGTLDREHTGKPEDDLHGATEGLIAIDGDKVRYDIVRPDFIVDKRTIEVGTQSGRVTARTVKGISTRRFADDRTRVTAWHSDNSFLVISQSRDLADRRRGEYFDIRGITLFDQSAIDRQYTLEQMFDHLIMFCTKYRGKVSGVDSATWVLSWSHQDDTPWITRWTLTVDVKSGFTPTSYKCESRFTKKVDDLVTSLGSKPISSRESETLAHLRGNEEKWLVEWENKTDWAEISGVWVPTHHESKTFRGPFSSVAQKKTSDFRWDSVNQAINENLFNYTTFEIPENVGIQDVSGGSTVWIKKLPGSDIEEEPAFETRDPWKFIIGVTLTVAMILAILVALRWKKRSVGSGGAGAQ